MREAVESAHRGIALIDDDDLLEPWVSALVSVAANHAVHPAISGRANRLLLDLGRIDQEEAAVRMSRRLSPAAPAPAAAAWLDGFLSGESVLLVHDPELLGIVDGWVGGVGDETFEDLLPLLRRTFSRFEPPERRAIGEEVVRLGSGATAERDPTRLLDLDRAAPAVARVAALLGLEVIP